MAETLFADPMRAHHPGRQARDLLESARGAIAATFGADADRIVVTSGGTEAVHLAVQGSVLANRTRPARVLSTAIEHSAVLAAADAVPVEHHRIPVDEAGLVNLDALEEQLRQGALLVNCIAASHEVGTLQPLAQVAALCRAYDALLHVDCAQLAGRLPVTLTSTGADYLSFSGAKFGGGRGIGGLILSPRARLRPLLAGDERERRRRAGLEHLPGVAAMAEALLQLRPNDPDGPAAQAAEAVDGLRRRLRSGLAGAAQDVEVHGALDGAAPHIVAASALYCDGQALVSALDEAGFCVHSGSSCATTSGEPSHVLVAMGVLTHGHIRASLGPETTGADVDDFVATFGRVVSDLRGATLGSG